MSCIIYYANCKDSGYLDYYDMRQTPKQSHAPAEDYWPGVVNNTLCMGLEYVCGRGAGGVVSLYRLDSDETHGTSLAATLQGRI